MCITLALLLVGVAAITASQDDMGITEHHRWCPRDCPPASSRAIERWCYRAVAFLPAVAIVDNSLWDYVVGETYLVGAWQIEVLSIDNQS